MRGFVVEKFAHPRDIALSNNAPEPTLGPQQLLVDVYSAGLNFYDILQAQGKHQNLIKPPFTLGTEMAGRISANSPIPKGCTLKPGELIYHAHLHSNILDQETRSARLWKCPGLVCGPCSCRF